jgi:branched-chain amino acid transport system ATP-binding protein
VNSEPLLRAESLTCRFGGVVAVDDFSFAVREGEILGLIGPNGAGKSTTFNMITGFLRPSTGEVFWQGKSTRRMRPEALARLGLTRTFQHESYWAPLTVRENVRLASPASPSRGEAGDAYVERLLQLTGLLGVADEFAENLPHGVQRLLSIAIGLGGRPRLLCLDEPLTGLNATEVHRVLEVLLALKAELGFTLMFVEHNVAAVMRISDRVIVLDAGRKLAEGTPAEVAANEAVIRAYLGEP